MCSEFKLGSLLSVANEQQTTLVRTAFSTIVRESLDLAKRVGLEGVTFRTHLAHRFSLTSAPVAG